ncbi:Peroxisome proliferator-activated receptor gamma coactivator- protein 1 [Ameca splendens]|uniref:Peroxisome proliferator-activated receptor gamma coactivator- protein 1 n=1 Tax=Ameca splendens TaxID=208324 RepID=A0ABV0XLG4_9TELE
MLQKHADHCKLRLSVVFSSSCSSKESRKCNREHEMRIQKLKAIDERRVVYVGRIRRTMTHDELRERFSQFGEVECVSLHFRDGGDHYGFVTFYNTEDAFAAIDNGGKLRNPDELPFDLCFGGRRQFCNSDYSDLDANRDADPPPPRSRFEDLDFDSLLKQAQRGQKR